MRPLCGIFVAGLSNTMFIARSKGLSHGRAGVDDEEDVCEAASCSFCERQVDHLEVLLLYLENIMLIRVRLFL